MNRAEIKEALIRGRRMYGTAKNENENAGTYTTSCGHCGKDMPHDNKTHRCVECGAKHDPE